MKLLSESLRRRKFIIWPGERDGDGGRERERERREALARSGRRARSRAPRRGCAGPQPGSVAASLPAEAGGAAFTSAARPAAAAERAPRRSRPPLGGSRGRPG